MELLFLRASRCAVFEDIKGRDIWICAVRDHVHKCFFSNGKSSCTSLLGVPIGDVGGDESFWFYVKIWLTMSSYGYVGQQSQSKDSLQPNLRSLSAVWSKTQGGIRVRVLAPRSWMENTSVWNANEDEYGHARNPLHRHIQIICRNQEGLSGIVESGVFWESTVLEVGRPNSKYARPNPLWRRLAHSCRRHLISPPGHQAPRSTQMGTDNWYDAQIFLLPNCLQPGTQRTVLELKSGLFRALNWWI